MLILALDTTSEAGGVGIFRGDECLALLANDGPANRYSITLFSLLDQAIEEAQARHGAPARGLADMGMIAVAAGPGSFTGIRIGLAAAQGWAKAFNLPVRGVSVLEALVEAAETRTEWAVAILDARRGEFYVGLFRRAAGVPQAGTGCPEQPAKPPLQENQFANLPIGEGWLLRPAELGPFLARRLPQGAELTCVVRAHDRAAPALRGMLAGSFRWRAVAGTLVASVARLGLRGCGKPQAAGELDACYIRRPDAELAGKTDIRDSKIEIRSSHPET